MANGPSEGVSLVTPAGGLYNTSSPSLETEGPRVPRDEDAMPHTKSAKKHQRQSEKRRLRNRAIVKSIKTQLKRFQSVAEDGTLEALQAEYNLASKRLDKAAAKRVIHPNLAARKKSQLARVLQEKAKTSPPAPPTPTPSA